MDKSIKGLMNINRGRFFYSTLNIHTPENPTPDIPIVIPVVQPPVILYTLSDFGYNAINNHSSYDASHSEKCQTIFNAVTKDFRDRCTSYQSYKTDEVNDTMVMSSNLLKYSKTLKSDIIFTPYVNAAYWMNNNYGGFILSVASHYDNDGMYDIAVGSDNNRHDITPNANTFLSESVAVSARRDTPELFKNSTSEGFGMEFFEDCSSAALDAHYPDKDLPIAFAQFISVDGINLTSTANPAFTQWLHVGEEITIRYSSDENTWQTTTITDIIGGDHIVVSPVVTPISTSGIYGWHNVTLGTFLNGQTESWATPIVAGKLKVIKMSTNADWNTVRMAARATAKRNHTGIPEIDNANWDIYRGFGCIQVQDAIDYINNNI